MLCYGCNNREPSADTQFAQLLSKNANHEHVLRELRFVGAPRTPRAGVTYVINDPDELSKLYDAICNTQVPWAVQKNQLNDPAHPRCAVEYHAVFDDGLSLSYVASLQFLDTSTYIKFGYPEAPIGEEPFHGMLSATVRADVVLSEKTIDDLRRLYFFPKSAGRGPDRNKGRESNRNNGNTP